MRRHQISVIGGGEAPPALYEMARRVGAAIAGAGCVVVCGGLGGVMEAACRGAREAGGEAIAIVPGTSHAEANPYATHRVVTGLGHGRNDPTGSHLPRQHSKRVRIFL